MLRELGREGGKRKDTSKDAKDGRWYCLHFRSPDRKRIWARARGGEERGDGKKVSGCANVPYFLRTEMKLKHKLENSGPDSWAKVSRHGPRYWEKIYAQPPNVMNE